jgi:hypothetical protein
MESFRSRPWCATTAYAIENRRRPIVAAFMADLPPALTIRSQVLRDAFTAQSFAGMVVAT